MLDIAAMCEASGRDLILMTPSGLVDYAQFIRQSDVIYRPLTTMKFQQSNTSLGSSPLLDDDTWTCCLLSVLQSTDQAKQDFSRHVNTYGLPSPTTYVLLTLFCEVIDNICCHAQLTPDQTIRVFVKRLPTSVAFCFVDAGISFDWSLAYAQRLRAEKPVDHQRDHFGLEIIHSLADSLCHKRVLGTRNVLRLIKEI
jgi:anti-sigma regulatory factor (Ser/Thr protein kinase)